MTNIHAQQLGILGGRKSVEKRFAGKSKQEISEIMRNVRYTKQELTDGARIVKSFVRNLNKNVTSLRPD